MAILIAGDSPDGDEPPRFGQRCRLVSWLVQPRLINDPFGDPGVYLDFRFGRRALLFDLGDLTPLSAGELMRVSHVFVSHAHMDHFAGFDRLLRLCLHRPEPLHLVGPPGFADRVQHRLESYTWNLLGGDSAAFRLVVAEFHAERVARLCEFPAREAFRPREPDLPGLPTGVVLEEGQFRVEAVTLDHHIPCLAFALHEPVRVNVWRPMLDALGLPVGPWLNRAKEAVRLGLPDSTRIEAGEGTSVTLAELKAGALRVAPGQKVAYVTDAGFDAANGTKIVALARGADQLFIEAAFLEEDAQAAARTRHLTAAQAGRLARLAGAKHVVAFHFSARYLDRPDALAGELRRAFDLSPEAGAASGPGP